jgi:hypothetical protein
MTGSVVEPQSDTLKKLYAYWRKKKGKRPAPLRAAIAPEEIKALLPNIYLIDVVGEGPRFRFRLVGTGVAEGYGDDITGKFLDELDLDMVGDEINAQYHQAVAECRPILHRWNYTKKDGRHIEYERLILPLASTGDKVDMLLCGAVAERIYQERRPA